MIQLKFKLLYYIGFDDNRIINAVQKIHGNIGNVSVQRNKSQKSDRSINTNICINSNIGRIGLIEKVLLHGDNEIHNLMLLNELGASVPKVYLTPYSVSVWGEV